MTSAPDRGIDVDGALRDRLRAVQARITSATLRVGRDPTSVKLIAVSKTHPVETLRVAFNAGMTTFGENRVQEAMAKIQSIGCTPEWHLIGALQTNKAKHAVASFDVIHSLDRFVLGRALSTEAIAFGKRCCALVQVNVAGKETQGGVAPDRLEALVRELVVLPSIDLFGLMCIAPAPTEVGGVDAIRRTFQAVAIEWGKLAGLARDHGHSWHHLSMGMTGDFEVAIEEGATMVRIGRAIFGDRST
jgi:pyridoxal phosphate enzyme (YggS family)